MNRSFRAVLFAIVAAATAGGALALAAGAPHSGGTVVYAIGAAPGTLNPP
ncbi:MAG: hypothetical protein GIW95_00795, partial [Candidatus Eremiobacteraeota bacterium]|nr:hypothetical protein [Candidatus Eremiobacteraeota bacterium]